MFAKVTGTSKCLLIGNLIGQSKTENAIKIDDNTMSIKLASLFLNSRLRFICTLLQ